MEELTKEQQGNILTKEKKILLNDLLQLEDLKNVKIRFNKSNNDDFDPIKLFEEGGDDLINGHLWNGKTKSFQEGNITIGLARIKGDKWLLFDINKITKDLNKKDNVGYESESLSEYIKYFGRLIVKYHNKSQKLIRYAENFIDELEVLEILPEKFNNYNFPGYENVDLSFDELKRVLDKKDWKTALENQKGVYLITDTNNGKLYVGSAYGEEMILGRWKTYIRTGHGGNKKLKGLEFNYIKKYFKYSILDIYKYTTEDEVILKREEHWKKILQSRKFGYNAN